jgi:NADPH:quinone reductase-like Zn-dependent oxidoreductase
MTANTTQAFWTTGPLSGELRPTDVDGSLAGAGTNPGPPVRLRSLCSGISRGTETLVFRGNVPRSQYQAMRAPFQQGDFPWPVKYGYANVAEVVDGPDHLRRKPVFCLYPHQQEYRVPVGAVHPLPEGMPPRRAILAANMETAVNGLWDAAPRVGDRIAVIGCGVVGLLVAWLGSRIPGARVIAIDINEARRQPAEALGLAFTTDESRDDHDIVIHASGKAEGLNTALSMLGMEGRVIEMSWYGTGKAPVALGEAFHSRRLTIRSSQVGQINPQQQPRHGYLDRMALALSLLQAPELDVLVNAESAFEDLPRTLFELATGQRDSLCHCIRY